MDEEQAQEQTTTSFEEGGVEYELVYPEKRIEMAEAALGNRSCVQVMGSYPTLRDLKVLAAYGLREVGQVAWVNPARAQAVIGDHIASAGMSAVMDLVGNALMRDAGFLFQQG